MIFHPDAAYLDDVKGLRRYIESELNVRDTVFSSDEDFAGVRYKAAADWAVLGRKLRKDLGKVKNALPNVSSDEVKRYVETGTIHVNGIELQTGDLTVQRYLELPPNDAGQYGTHTDNDVVIRLDIQVYPDLQGEWLARELTNRVQKLRKKAGLQATDDINVFFRFEEGVGSELLSSLDEYGEGIKKALGGVPLDISKKKGGEVIMEEEQDIAETKFVLYLVKP